MYVLSKNIADLRIKNNYTQKELATALGVSKGTITTYETGARTPPIEKLEKIAELFNIEITDFFVEDISQIDSQQNNKSTQSETSKNSSTLNVTSENNSNNPLNIGEMIKELRVSKNLTQEELAEKINVNKATIANYEANRRALTIDKLEIILSELEVTLQDFFSNKNYQADYHSSNLPEFQESNIEGTINRIPIISRVSAGEGVYGVEDILEWLEMPISLCDSADYATFVKGDSMEPKIYDNDLILVRKQNYIENGKIGIFKVDDEVFCKKFFSNPITKEVVLKSLNSIYEPIYITKENKKEFHILGKVICKIDYNF